VSIVSTIHFVLAFLVVLCALVFSWDTRGRRVINAVLGLQALCGIVLVSADVLVHAPVPIAVWYHVAGTLGALLAYGFARRLGDRPGGGRTALLPSVAGLLCICATAYLGVAAAGQI
jgi:hypothetical protein